MTKTTMTPAFLWGQSVPRFVNGRERAEVIVRKATYVLQLKGVVVDVEVGVQKCAGLQQQVLLASKTDAAGSDVQ